MLDITGEDISELNDADLRNLVGRLCEAELRGFKISTAGVTWGGHQDAPDGGLDVRVEITTTLPPDSYIPRANTGFQVKKPDMPKAIIISEMKPGGELRPVIQELVEKNGAYIIVSSNGSTADFALKNRKAAMDAALSKTPNASEIKVDFYDRNRIASWVRSHPALIIWVRGIIGKPIQGWKPYENWSHPNCDGIEDYIFDDDTRIYNTGSSSSESVSVLEGIHKIRNILGVEGASVRIVGLSGVGKTKLLQVLFDERVGENSLNKSQVFYSDYSDEPIPDPCGMAEYIVSLGEPALLAIDNCPPELHRKLTIICSQPSSFLSLITVEYDVREDQPEETEVFRLENASQKTIESLIRIRFPNISHVDAETIAKFSGGNARVAIALANTVRKGESLSEFGDKVLFERLFDQRNTPNDNLLRAAEVCALVYSFDITTSSDENLELSLLASLVEISVLELYKYVSELERRELVQKRNIWRAILPHAIANNLAVRALENIPLENILDAFVGTGSERLLKSFSRRLSYLHECEAAKEVLEMWVSGEGLLADISNLNDFGITLVKNIAPINPQRILEYIESGAEQNKNFLTYSNPHYAEFGELLRSIAYDKELFKRSVELICKLYLSEKSESETSDMDLLIPLFYIQFSGTHSPAEDRIVIIKNLIESNIDVQIELGILLLEASLKTDRFQPHHSFEFGANSRNYGLHPKNNEDMKKWFSLFLNYAKGLVTSEFCMSDRVEAMLANRFRGLWVHANLYGELELIAETILKKGVWLDGYIAVIKTKKFHGNKMETDEKERLSTLEEKLAPNTLIERARLFGLATHNTNNWLIKLLEDENNEAACGYAKIQELTQDIGKEVATSDSDFKEILPDLFTVNGANQFYFGKGLAEGCLDPLNMWEDFCAELSKEKEINNYQVLGGVINTLSIENPSCSDEILGVAITRDVLQEIYPPLEASSELNTNSVKRLIKSLELNLAPIHSYKNLAFGGVHKNINDQDLCKLLRLIISKPGGMPVAVEIFHMRIFGVLSDKKRLGDIIIDYGQELLAEESFSPSESDGMNDHRFAEIINSCFANDAASDSARVLCANLASAISEGRIFRDSYHQTIESLAKTQPIAFLSGFVSRKFDALYRIKREFFDDSGPTNNSNPLLLIDNDLIINWCEEDPKSRYLSLAFLITPYESMEEDGALNWSPLFLRMLEKCSNPIRFLKIIFYNFEPESWIGSMADIMQKRLKLLLELRNHDSLLISDYVTKKISLYEKNIKQRRRWESTRARPDYDSFE